jgi:arylsulfatase A
VPPRPGSFARRSVQRWEDNQTTDIAADYPDRLQRMKEQMLEINASIMADGHEWHLQN